MCHLCLMSTDCDCIKDLLVTSFKITKMPLHVVHDRVQKNVAKD